MPLECYENNAGPFSISYSEDRSTRLDMKQGLKDAYWLTVEDMHSLRFLLDRAINAEQNAERKRK